VIIKSFLRHCLLLVFKWGLLYLSFRYPRWRVSLALLLPLIPSAAVSLLFNLCPLWNERNVRRQNELHGKWKFIKRIPFYAISAVIRSFRLLPLLAGIVGAWNLNIFVINLAQIALLVLNMKWNRDRGEKKAFHRYELKWNETKQRSLQASYHNTSKLLALWFITKWQTISCVDVNLSLTHSLCRVPNERANHEALAERQAAAKW